MISITLSHCVCVCRTHILLTTDSNNYVYTIHARLKYILVCIHIHCTMLYISRAVAALRFTPTSSTRQAARRHSDNRNSLLLSQRDFRGLRVCVCVYCRRCRACEPPHSNQQPNSGWLAGWQAGLPRFIEHVHTNRMQQQKQSQRINNITCVQCSPLGRLRRWRTKRADDVRCAWGLLLCATRAPSGSGNI